MVLSLTTILILAAATAGPSTASLVVQFAIAIFAPSGLATVITAVYMRRRIVNSETGHKDADAVQLLTNASTGLLEPMQKQIKFLGEQLESANKKITELTTKVDDLNNKLDRYEETYGDLPPVVE